MEYTLSAALLAHTGIYSSLIFLFCLTLTKTFIRMQMNPDLSRGLSEQIL